MKSGSKDQIDAMDFDLFRETTQPASKAADVAKPKARLCEPWVMVVSQTAIISWKRDGQDSHD